MREFIIKPLHTLKFRQHTPYAIIVDALDECFSAEEARLIALFIDVFLRPGLADYPPDLIFTSRPEAHIRSAMQAGIHEISLTTRNHDTPWPSENEFETLAFKALPGGLFVYAAMVIIFISTTGHHSKQRLDLLLREKSAVGADIDQLHRQIISTSENLVAHYRMLASITQLLEPLQLVDFQDLFHEDQTVTLEVFSSIILSPPDGVGSVEIYHDSLLDFLKNPLRSKHCHVADAYAHEHRAVCSLDLLIRYAGYGRFYQQHGDEDRSAYDYAHDSWAVHLSRAYPSSKLQNRLALLMKGAIFAPRQDLSSQYYNLRRARDTCLSLKWIRSPSDIVVAWRVVKGLRRAEAQRNEIYTRNNTVFCRKGPFFLPNSES
ncbi:hypothetical protein M405DRAFT_815395 [Rhizopogon salebrosus TDB-379]|nr:hypothetical protein M405DRAFT_815395 [Rhizopogon salebrosus TDB-379]